MGDEDGSKSFDFSELGANPRVIKDDREDIRKRLRESKNRIWTNEEAKPDTPISLAELSALYRLKTLIKMCENLAEIMARMSKWLENNKKAFAKATGLSQILDYVRRMFESVCAIGEVFHLTSVNWSTAKYSKILKPGDDEYNCGEDGRLEISTPDKYCPQLMNQINYFRWVNDWKNIEHSIFTEHSCTLSPARSTVSWRPFSWQLTQRDAKFDRSKPGEIELRIERGCREIKAILQRLPPQYMLTKDTMKLSTRTGNLLEHPPKNELSFPMKAMVRQWWMLINPNFFSRTVTNPMFLWSQRSTSLQRCSLPSTTVREAPSSKLEKVIGHNYIGF